MLLLGIFLTGIVVLEHIFFLYLEMFAWETLGKKLFRGTLLPELFSPTKVMAANQGLYNGFLAMGLIWTFFIKDDGWSQYIRVFFLSCILTAGIYGGITANKKIFYIQSIPALLALIPTIFHN